MPRSSASSIERGDERELRSFGVRRERFASCYISRTTRSRSSTSRSSTGKIRLVLRYESMRDLPGLGLALFVGCVAPASALAQASDLYRAHLRTGVNSVVVGDRETAERAFREAVALSPSLPDAYCYRAEMHRAGGETAAALDSFRDCLRFARETNDRRFLARALHGIASTLERMPDRAEEAREAWREFVQFADGAAGVADPRVGRARIEAIDAWLELERRMVEVRARIAERERAAR